MMHPSELFKRITMPKSNFFRHIGKHLSYKFHKVRKDKTIYVCFQGSNGMTDWLHNFLFKPRRMETYKGCGWFVHAGFARVWRSGSDTVMKELRKLHERLPGFKIVFCGFSHGGPLAMLAAKKWHHITGQRCECVTFGSPKLAWGDAARRVLSNAMILTNWVNRADAITALPFDIWGFLHVLLHLVNVRSIPILSLFRIHKHHLIYSRPEIYPENWRRAA